MTKAIEYGKKISLIRKLFRIERISEIEYERIRKKLMNEYMVLENKPTESNMA